MVRPLSRRLSYGALVLALLFVGCAPEEPEERYELRGKVVSVDREKRRVTIEHEEIPGYMPAMTMPFRVKDEWVLDAAQPGSFVNADLVVAGKASWIERVAVTTEGGPPSEPSRREGAVEPALAEPAPPIDLVRHDESRVSLDDYRGKAVALTFIYTRCPLPDYCPLMTDNFLAVERGLRGEPSIAAATQLLSISIDPEFDTPAVMKNYAERVSDESRIPPNWDFLTGSPAEVRKVAEGYGLAYETQGNEVIHTLRTAIIAPDGTLYKMYRGNEWKPEELLADLKELVLRNGSSAQARN